MKHSPEPIIGAAAWHGTDIADDNIWQFTLDQADLDELDDALNRAKSQQKQYHRISVEDFPLPTLKSRLDTIADTVENGCGFARLRGLSMDRWSKEDLQLIWMGIALHLGQPVFQNPEGQLLREIKAEPGNIGQRYGQLQAGTEQFLSSRARTASSAELRYHTDRTDIVGLLCTGVAREGGLSKISSSVTVHNEML
jgi:hypothetical protein